MDGPFPFHQPPLEWYAPATCNPRPLQGERWEVTDADH